MRKSLDINHDFEGRLLSLKFSFKYHVFNILENYAPVIPTSRKTFFKCLQFFVFAGTKICIGGDYNCVM